MSRIIAIDPGLSGAIATYRKEYGIKIYDMPRTTKEFIDLIYPAKVKTIAYIEHIQPRENDKLHVSSAMKLMKNNGICLGACHAYSMDVKIIKPSIWMSGMIATAMNYSERKKSLHEVAKKFFPKLKIKKSQADALCLLRWAMVKEGIDYEN